VAEPRASSRLQEMSITAAYSGDSTFTESTSSPLNQVVDRAVTTTMLTSSKNPSQYGQKITFTATVLLLTCPEPIRVFPEQKVTVPVALPPKLWTNRRGEGHSLIVRGRIHARANGDRCAPGSIIPISPRCTNSVRKRG
jgi:hypothetical protein